MKTLQILRSKRENIVCMRQRKPRNTGCHPSWGRWGTGHFALSAPQCGSSPDVTPLYNISSASLPCPSFKCQSMVTSRGIRSNPGHRWHGSAKMSSRVLPHGGIERVGNFYWWGSQPHWVIGLQLRGKPQKIPRDFVNHLWHHHDRYTIIKTAVPEWGLDCSDGERRDGRRRSYRAARKHMAALHQRPRQKVRNSNRTLLPLLTGSSSRCLPWARRSIDPAGPSLRAIDSNYFDPPSSGNTAYTSRHSVARPPKQRCRQSCSATAGGDRWTGVEH